MVVVVVSSVAMRAAAVVGEVDLDSGFWSGRSWWLML